MTPMTPDEVNNVLEIVDALISEAWTQGRLTTDTAMRLAIALGLLQRAHEIEWEREQ